MAEARKKAEEEANANNIVEIGREQQGDQCLIGEMKDHKSGEQPVKCKFIASNGYQRSNSGPIQCMQNCKHV